MLAPVLGRARDKGRAAACQSNLRQLVMSAILYDEDHQVLPIGWPQAAWVSDGVPLIWYRQLQPYVGRDKKVAGQGIFICPSSLQKAKPDEKIGNGLRVGGFWGYLSYAQNGHVNNGENKVNARQIQDPSNTILYGDTDGWDACLYPDGDPTANVCYRHSGGSERSSETDRSITGGKKFKGRANAGFIDTHVELIRNAPARLFTLERD
jgi:prepilin-type processing-associated H-X9-DG protein